MQTGGLPQLGSIEPGKEASPITLSQVIFTQSALTHKNTNATSTWIVG